MKGLSLAAALGSLRARLLLATVAAIAVALLLAGLLLDSLFRAEVLRQFRSALQQQLDQVTARLDFGADGRPQLNAALLSDPRWSRPYSGLYWQLDVAGAAAGAASLRSRSLWDFSLTLPADLPADGGVHEHRVDGPQGSRLVVLERTLSDGSGASAGPAPRWRLAVAADAAEAMAAMQRFQRTLVLSLLALWALLALAGWAQVGVGLAPLRALAGALQALREGRRSRLDGRFPAEVQPLVDDFNRVLDRNAEVVERARTQAGNLAHAIKTPLAVLQQAADAATDAQPPGDVAVAALAATVREQVGSARRQVDWHMAHARAAAQGGAGQRTALAPVVSGLLRVLERVHAERGLQLDNAATDPALAFAGEAQDLHEILGNLLDNACKWAQRRVRVSAALAAAPADGTPGSAPQRRLCVWVDDDGPGIAAERRDAVLARGTRLDESVPGSGLGLSIALDLVRLYRGQLRLGTSPMGGLRAALDLPVAPVAAIDAAPAPKISG